MHTPENNQPVKVITSARIDFRDYIYDVWKYKNLILVFAMQELKVQYVQTRLNLLWVVLKPLMVLLLFTFIFDGLITIPGVHYPYPLFAFTGLIIWNNFSFMVNNAGGVIISNQHIVKKMYFPKIILVLSKILIGLVEVSVSVALLFVLILIIRYPLHWQVIFLPLFIAAGLVLGTAIAVWVNALSIRYRDLYQFIPTVIGFMIWLTPVFYPITLVPEKYSFIIYFNPVAGVIQGCRWCILGDAFPSFLFLPAILFSVMALISGTMIFVMAEADLADYI